MGAMEEAMLALDYVPSYLALHGRMAEILIKTGNKNAGMVKLRTIARTHMVRGEIPQATAVYDRIVRANPIDVETRKQMIDLLAQQDRVEDAIKQDLELADLFKHMAQLDSARETLLAALMLSQRGRIDPKWAIQILEMMGDIDLSRLDVRQALEDFEQICELDPENEPARAHVIDLNLRLGQEKQAAEALDIHLDQLVKAGRGQDALTMIEDLAREYPGKQALHSRLAEAYRAADRKADAIAQYDALGEIQLDAGQVQEAIQTIQIIIDLDPPNIEDYEELIRNIQ